MINTINNIFQELEADKNKLMNKNNTLERIIPTCSFSGVKFFLYYSPSTSKRGLRVGLSKDDAKMRFSIDSKGFTYKYEASSLYIEEDKEYITNIFKVFISELLPKKDIGNHRIFFDNFRNKILEWRDFFQDIKQIKPSEESVKGLFGELSYLKHLLSNDQTNSVNYWTGPLGARSDFFINKARIEIKTTTTTNPVKISISNSNQLNVGVNELYLVLYELISNEGGYNIKHLVNDISDLLDINRIPKSEFCKKLESIGCNDEFLLLTENICYQIEKITKYKVNDGFPSIIKDSIQDFRVEFN